RSAVASISSAAAFPWTRSKAWSRNASRSAASAESVRARVTVVRQPVLAVKVAAVRGTSRKARAKAGPPVAASGNLIAVPKAAANGSLTAMPTASGRTIASPRPTALAALAAPLLAVLSAAQLRDAQIVLSGPAHVTKQYS